LPNVGPYIYTTLAFLALLGAPYIYDISSLRVNTYMRWILHVNLVNPAFLKNALSFPETNIFYYFQKEPLCELNLIRKVMSISVRSISVLSSRVLLCPFRAHF